MIEDKIKEWASDKEKEFNIVIKFYPEKEIHGVSLHGKKVMLDLGYSEDIFTMIPDFFKWGKTPEEKALYRYYTYPKNPNKFILLNRGGQVLTGYHDTLEGAINELLDKELVDKE